MDENIPRFGIFCQWEIYMACKYLTRKDLAAYAVGVALFGERLRQLREDRGWTLEDVQKKMGYKKPEAVSNLEAKVWPPTPRLFYRLIATLGYSAGEFAIELPSLSRFGSGRLKRPPGRPKKKARPPDQVYQAVKRQRTGS
jgi:transcriptional regulator with XRE-family HTH domain